MPYKSIGGERYDYNFSGLYLLLSISLRRNQRYFRINYKLFVFPVKTYTGDDILTVSLDGGGKYDNNEFRTQDLTEMSNLK
jgi:hypothetical protein